jgi:hypothetical protein
VVLFVDRWGWDLGVFVTAIERLADNKEERSPKNAGKEK